MNKEDKETKLVSILKFLGGLFVILAILLLILRMIIDSIYGGAHFEKTNNILLIIAFFMGSLAYSLEKRIMSAFFFGVLFIFHVLFLFGI
ncbi:hypothetical protein BU594_09070 [Staphylococcus arlettae]|jgi:hypothetical protein|uniref:hypothetical protein n=1 Tax=Staphylococcus TaxID=1279 RepID=UPI000D1E55FF|nr:MULTISPECIES: hypothetical protein [Staphylococcus]PTK44927.1 hypothetical protein BUZ69_12420 [Staphylococcus saprophyticus]RIM72462.1 hypothetical protein BU594_09070 [Staphylococcus arlettae]